MSGSPRRRWFALPAIGAVLIALCTGCAAQQQPQQEPPASTPTSSAVATTSAPSHPDSLEVPAIDVHTGQIVDLGLTGSGELEVPKDAVTTGWFTGSPSPGEPGPAVIAAHVDYNHVLGTFHRLEELRPGDQALVHRADRTTAVFTVYQVDAYPKTSFPTDAVYGDTEGPELRMITCGGAYDKAARSYDDNIVAYAKLTEVRKS